MCSTLILQERIEDGDAEFPDHCEKPKQFLFSPVSEQFPHLMLHTWMAIYKYGLIWIQQVRSF
jgi:hypothetical protein